MAVSTEAPPHMTRPLAYRLLRQLETPVAARIRARKFWGYNDPPPELTIEEVGQVFGPATEYTAPDAHTERAQYFDVVGRQDVRGQAGSVTLELVRQAVAGVAVVEKIGTWLRASAVNGAGETVSYELYDGATKPGVEPVGSPFPFPLNHPIAGELRVTWWLFRERVPSSGQGVQPAFAGIGPATVMPYDTPLLTPWSDQRYGMHAGFAGGLYFVTGDRALLRMFATITITGGTWNLEIGGRLGGIWQNTGYRGAALQTALRH